MYNKLIDNPNTKEHDMYNQEITAMIEAQKAYDTVNSELYNYISLFDWALDCEDEDLFNEYLDIIAEVTLNKQVNLNLDALYDAKIQAEDKVIELMTELVSENATIEEQEEVNETLKIAKKSIVARNKVLNLAKEMVHIA